MEIDQRIKYKPYGEEEGATACVVLMTPYKIYCANAGDSRAIVK